MRQILTDTDLEGLKRNHDYLWSKSLTIAKVILLFVGILLGLIVIVLALWLIGDAIYLCYVNSFKNNPTKLENSLAFILGHSVSYIAGLVTSVVYAKLKHNKP